MLAGVLAAVVLGGVTPFLSRVALLYSFKDDAFYYLQIARNVAAGEGFTFDGLHFTNGFHPLWLFCLIPAARALPGDLPLVRFAAILQLVLVALACTEIVSALRPRVGYWSCLAGILMLVALPGTQFVLFSGMETALLLWLSIRIWRCWSALGEREDAPVWQWIVLGIWCSLAFLARLEAAFMTPLIVVFSYRHWRRRYVVLCAICAAPVVTAATYFAWNRVVFGIWIPISGIIKSSSGFAARFDPRMTVPRRLLSSYLPLSRAIASTGLSPRAALWVYCACLLVLAAIVLKRRRDIWRLVVASETVLPLAMCLGLWLIENIWLPYAAPWYPIAPFLGTAFLVAALSAPKPRFARALAVILIAMGLGRAAINTRRALHIDHDRTVEAAEWARAHVPLNDRIGSWNAGTFAYFSHRHVINLDGLVNNLDYYNRVLIGRQFAEYVADEKIGWFADGVLSPESLEGPTFAIAPYEKSVSVRLAYSACAWKSGLCSGFAVWRVNTNSALAP